MNKLLIALFATIVFSLNSEAQCDATFTSSNIDCDSIWFVPNSMGSQYVYSWDFGDGNSSNYNSPTNTYSADGSYTVVLTLQDTIANCTQLFTQVVTINCGGSCNVQTIATHNVDASNCSALLAGTATGGTPPYSYYWDFGDGTSGTQPTQMHQYPNNSTWTACLTVTDALGCVDTFCMPIIVTCAPPPCDAQFSTSNVTCDSLFFYPVSTGPQYSYTWDFGDGNTGVGAAPSHLYAADGTYIVTLTLVDNVGNCTQQYLLTIVVNCGATPCSVNGAWAWNIDSTNCDISFVSTAFAGTAPYTYFWSFGDGTSSTLPHPTHNYPNNTAWTPCLTITDANGCDTTICDVVSSTCTPTSCDALFTTSYVSCDSLFFYPVSMGSQYTYYWDFGDGTSSTYSNPTHQYTADGAYVVVLTLTDTVSGCSDLFSYTVAINCGTSCTVDGAITHTLNANNCEVTFASSAWGGQAPYTYFWNFGDGSTSALANPTHQYPNNSTWTPCLTITDANGCDTTICDVVYSTCTPTSCDANFTVAHVTCDSVFFYPVSTGSQYTYDWHFGDGGTSNAANPTHQYATDGSYLAYLIIMDSISGCTDILTIQVDINCGATPCSVNGAWAWNIDSTNCDISFVSTAFAGTAPYTYFWSFGDGTSSTLPHPTHTYPNNTAWTPCLTITDANGCDTTICDVVYSTCTPTSCDALFTTSYVSCDSLFFYPVSMGSQYTYYWDFGDGTSSTYSNPTHQYTADGIYVVVLTLTDTVSGCSDLFSYSVSINCGTSCTVDGAITHTLNTNNCEVTFASSAWGGQAPYTYFWNFGDGTTSSLANPTHQYPNNSTWTPCLIITDANGCDTTICDVVIVNCISSNCDATFTNTFISCDSVWFIPAVSNSAYDYLWDFGDGTTSTDISPTHTFSNGSHTIVLYLTDSSTGCSVAYTSIVTVNCAANCSVNGAISWYADSTSCDVSFVSTAFGGQAPYTYFWNFGDGTTSALANPVHAYPPSTAWTPCLTITDANGCDTTICDVVGSACTVGFEGIQQLNELLIYPNPVLSTFTIELNGDSEIELYDMSGKIVYSESCIDGCQQLTVNINHLQSGAYLIRVVTDETIITQRIIKN